jgi:hypothetical protein
VSESWLDRLGSAMKKRKKRGKKEKKKEKLLSEIKNQK